MTRVLWYIRLHAGVFLLAGIIAFVALVYSSNGCSHAATVHALAAKQHGRHHRRCLEDEPCWNPCMGNGVVGIHSRFVRGVHAHVGEMHRFTYTHGSHLYACTLLVIRGRP